ncbi:AAA family ATPase [Halalkalibacterium halodurans]|uniref:Magnesium chelatase n=1 Tax=Halalkalibacterium halodurans TaxID=86665 RepID=A0A0M0KCW6_ALKHA|nr:MoxR family ATPase [Halalkalibacterium halodurans]MDY7221236.1 MoxR family ATPase [Halalkalibacterium halodurans]MDY7240475.1 MoxR family ATPase [Halalkalibacterium halodurans]MED4163725.1 MoxR family ATPase [Halalkalibacterium halodurans]TPE70075.1 MoxR family ATPase [Halalkalibacterium halodurans]
MQQLLQQMDQVIIGQQKNIRLLLTAFLAGGHVLLEGVPGIGKTKMVRELADLTDGDFKRVQFTPDMMPSDVTGNVIFNSKDNDFQMVKGPVFTNLLLADEINRTPPRTQAALLEAMEERQVTIQGETYQLPDPFFVVATQNPIEYEGTYPLPEAQLDRFLFKLEVTYPSLEAELQIVKGHVPFFVEQGNETDGRSAFSLAELRELRQQLQQVVVEDSLMEYMVTIIRKTREDQRVMNGASPRAAIALMMAARAWALLDGRQFVTPDDIKMITVPALRHRLQLTPQVELEGETSDHFIQETLASVPVPR